MRHGIAAALLMLGLGTAGCDAPEQPVQPPGAEPPGPEMVIGIDTLYVWFPVDEPGSTQWTWNGAAADAWEYMWDAAIDVREWGVTLHVSFVRPSDGGPPVNGTFAEMAAGARGYIWTTNTATGFWEYHPRPFGDVTVTDGGVNVGFSGVFGEQVHAFPPTPAQFWNATFTIRTPGKQDEHASARVRYLADDPQKLARTIRGPLSGDEYAIMQAVVESYRRWYLGDDFYLLTPTWSGVVSSFETHNISVLGASLDTRNSYLAARRSESDLTAFSQIGYAVTDYESLPRGQWGPSVQYIRLSTVGINRDRDQAMVYGSYYCGFLCAEADVFLLEKVNGYWHIRRSVMLWIS